MISLSSENKPDLQRFHIGGKAGNLYRLQELGLNVPRFIVIPQEVLHHYLPESIRNSDPEIIRKFIKDIHISQEEIEDLLREFPCIKDIMRCAPLLLTKMEPLFPLPDNLKVIYMFPGMNWLKK
jgi:phosphoenolpyruvate synthase/pyruvate phosphate dikinase